MLSKVHFKTLVLKNFTIDFYISGKSVPSYLTFSLLSSKVLHRDSDQTETHISHYNNIGCQLNIAE